MARVELPASRLKARKRRQRIRILIFFGGLILLVGGLVIGASYIPVIQISHIAVSGAKTLSSSTVQAFIEKRIDGRYAFVLPKRNIFLYPKRFLRDEILAAYPLLAAADVHAVDFHTIAVNVVEREPRALWCESQTRCMFMDEQGMVYAPAPTFSSPIYVSYFGTLSGNRLPKQYLSPEEFAGLSALVDATVRHLDSEEVLGVWVDGHDDAHLRFANGFAISFSLSHEEGDVFERFSLALTAEPFVQRPLSDFEYLDLRFGDKLYYKLKSE